MIRADNRSTTQHMQASTPCCRGTGGTDPVGWVRALTKDPTPAFSETVRQTVLEDHYLVRPVIDLVRTKRNSVVSQGNRCGRAAA